MKYNSNRNFKPWAYTVSHAFLLIRSPNDADNESDALLSYNIDIEFWGVLYMDIPASFDSIEITEIKKDIPSRLSHYQNLKGVKFFQIVSNDNAYNIVAGGCRVAKSKWLTENRVLQPELEYDEILLSFQ